MIPLGRRWGRIILKNITRGRGYPKGQLTFFPFLNCFWKDESFFALKVFFGKLKMSFHSVCGGGGRGRVCASVTKWYMGKGGLKEAKKCHVSFEWPFKALNLNFFAFLFCFHFSHFSQPSAFCFLFQFKKSFIPGKTCETQKDFNVNA